jgi:hypothetical protein
VVPADVANPSIMTDSVTSHDSIPSVFRIVFSSLGTSADVGRCC